LGITAAVYFAIILSKQFSLNEVLCDPHLLVGLAACLLLITLTGPDGFLVMLHDIWCINRKRCLRKKLQGAVDDAFAKVRFGRW
jgi:hypothetical protein